MSLDPGALRARHYNAVMCGGRLVHGTVMVLRVRPDRPVPPPRPGQWLELGLGLWEPVMEGAEAGSAGRVPPDTLVTRSYSVSSPILTPDFTRLLEPAEEDGFEFFLSLVVPPAERAKRVPNLTGRLLRLREGGRLFMSDTPMGAYGLDPVRPQDDVLFVATGTGEAPHNRMIHALLARGHAGRIASVVSVRHRDDLAYDAVHRRLMELFPRYRYAAFPTRDPGGDGRHLQDLLLDGTLEERAGFPIAPDRARVFLCGNPGMIGPPRQSMTGREFGAAGGMVELLETRRGLNADPERGDVNVHFERYW